MFRQAAIRNLNATCAARRAFHQSPVAAKTVGEVAHDVNIGVGKGLANAIEKGEKVAHKAKETLGASSLEKDLLV
jgi:ATP synthase mitochondrial F1 complex assembly factor 1